MNTDEFEIASTDNGTHFIIRGCAPYLSNDETKDALLFDKKILPDLIKALQNVEKER